MELRLLGPMTLLRNGTPVPLPASRKTRALLAYLAVSGKPERRDRLCQLLWDVPDDPRGALRWSLSKLRGILDHADRSAIVADRETAGIDSSLITVDWHKLRASRTALTDLSDKALEELAQIQGEFLEGLDIPSCDGFQAWSVAHREDGRAWQSAILAELAGRPIAPDRAVAHARRWTEIAPFDAHAHIALCRRLVLADRAAESRAQCAIGIHRLEEGALPVPRELRAFSLPLSTAHPEPQQDLPDQQVRFCQASDGTALAWSMVGKGLPLVKAANWLNHLEHDWDSPIWGPLLKALTSGRSLIRYDERGNGLSDWNSADISFEAFVNDLESVVDAAGIDRFDLMGVSQGCSVSMAYAVRHPERVRKLVLYGGYAAGWRARALPEEKTKREAMQTLTLIGWGQNNPAFRQMFTTLFLPDATAEQMDWFNELQRITASPENAVRLQDAFADIDVRAILGQIRVPTLVLHASDDAVVPFTSGRDMARAIPGARFVALESRNHLLLDNEAAWPKFAAAVHAFLED